MKPGCELGFGKFARSKCAAAVGIKQKREAELAAEDVIAAAEQRRRKERKLKTEDEGGAAGDQSQDGSQGVESKTDTSLSDVYGKYDIEADIKCLEAEKCAVDPQTGRCSTCQRTEAGSSTWRDEVAAKSEDYRIPEPHDAAEDAIAEKSATALSEEEVRRRKANAFRGAFSPCAITLVTLCGQFMPVLDQSILDVSIVAIASDLQSDLTSTQWIITAYYLCNCGFLPIAGRIGDRISKTRIYIIGMATFFVSSLACGLSTNLPMLIGFRCLQGIGGSFMMANTIPLITHFTPLATRGTAIGYNIVLVGIALSTGPVIGGYLTEYAGWPTLFYINLPISVIGIILVWTLVPDTPRRVSPIDWVSILCKLCSWSHDGCFLIVDFVIRAVPLW